MPKPIPQSALHNFQIDAESGVITRVGRDKPLGTKAGSTGYAQVWVEGHPYPSARVAWFLYYREQPPAVVSSINGVRTDTRKENLRGLDRVPAPRGASERNTSGVVGVCFNNRLERWTAQIRTGGENRFLLSSRSFEEAVFARHIAETLLPDPPQLETYTTGNAEIDAKLRSRIEGKMASWLN